jgi:hypothetical protein
VAAATAVSEHVQVHACKTRAQWRAQFADEEEAEDEDAMDWHGRLVAVD